MTAETIFSFSNFVFQDILLKYVTVIILFFKMSSKTQEININACKIMSVSQTLEQLFCKNNSYYFYFDWDSDKSQPDLFTA